MTTQADRFKERALQNPALCEAWEKADNARDNAEYYVDLARKELAEREAKLAMAKSAATRAFNRLMGKV